MGCRCNERRQALMRTSEAIADGDVQAVAAEATFIVKSSIEDAAQILRQKTAAARARLSRR